MQGSRGNRFGRWFFQKKSHWKSTNSLLDIPNKLSILLTAWLSETNKSVLARNHFLNWKNTLGWVLSTGLFCARNSWNLHLSLSTLASTVTISNNYNPNNLNNKPKNSSSCFETMKSKDCSKITITSLNLRPKSNLI